MNKKIKAFPSDQTKTDRYGNIQETHFEAGMTLRDYFAAKAMQSLLSQPGIGSILQKSGAKSMEEGDDTIAITAYRMADAMLKQREI